MSRLSKVVVSDENRELFRKCLEWAQGHHRVDLWLPVRRRENVDCRRAAMAILATKQNATSWVIGELLNKDRTTVSHHLRQHADLYGRDEEYTNIFESMLSATT